METRHDRTAWLKGGTTKCQAPPPEPKGIPRHVVLLGAPGVGKGTQADLLCAYLGSCHLSTGDIFRSARAQCACERTPALSTALEYMQRGELVPDETVVAMVRERVRCLECQAGFLLDGFPRTVPQAEALEKLLSEHSLQLDMVLNYEVPTEKVVQRLTGRRTCTTCKAVFHMETRPPRMEGVCDHCAGKLYQREDDRPEAIRVRMQAYEQSTLPLIRLYRSKGLLVSIWAEGTPEEIFNRTLDALEDRY